MDPELLDPHSPYADPLPVLRGHPRIAPSAGSETCALFGMEPPRSWSVSAICPPKRKRMGAQLDECVNAIDQKLKDVG